MVGCYTSNSIKTRMALSAHKGKCVNFSSAQIVHPYSCCSNWHISCIEWNFRGPFSTSQNHLSSLSTKWLQYGTKIFHSKRYLNKHTSTHAFTYTYTQDTSIIGTHTGPGPARTSERNSSLPFDQPRGNVCSIIRTCSFPTKKEKKRTEINRAKASEDFTVKCSISYTLLEIPTSIFLCARSPFRLL